jgi:uncharacterized protein YxeA
MKNNIIKTLLVVLLAVFCFGIMTAQPIMQNDNAEVYVGNKSLDVHIDDVSKTKDPIYYSFNLAIEHSFAAKSGYSFTFYGTLYTVKYENKIYSFRGFKTTLKKAMVSHLSGWMSTYYKTKEEPATWKPNNS